MIKKKNLMLLTLVFLCLLCILLGVKLMNVHIDKVKTTDEVIFTIDADELDSFEIINGEESLKFLNADGKWSVDGLDAFPVSDTLISDFLNHFEEVHAVFVINDVEDYSQYGLENSEVKAVFTSGDETKEIILGDFSQMDADRYVSVNDNNAYLVEDDLTTYMSCDKDDFMQQYEVDWFDSYTELVLTSDSSTDYIVYDDEGVYTYTDKYNYYEISTGKHLAVDDELVEDYADSAVTISLTDYASYEASSEDLSDFGLDNPEKTVTVRGKYDDEDSEMIIYLGKVDSGEVDEDGEIVYNRYARYDGSEIIYNITSYTYDKLIDGCYNSLRPKELLTLNWEDVSAVSITSDGETYDISIEQSDGEEEDSDDESDEAGYVYLLNGTEIEFDGVMDSIDDLSINEFCTGNAVSTKELSFKVSLSNDDYPELSVTLYRYDGDNCVAVLDGAQIGFISRSQVVSLKEALNSIIYSMDKE